MSLMTQNGNAMTELTISSDEIRSAIESYVSEYSPEVTREEVGVVTECGDGIATVEGLPSAMSNELLSFPGGVLGVALNLDVRSIGAVILGDANTIQEGQEMDFDIENDVRGRGQRATNVVLSDSAYNNSSR